MASGYIAGGAIAGIIIAILAGVPSMEPLNNWIASVAERNPAESGAWADAISLIPFAVLVLLLYLTGREKILAHREA